MEGKVYEEIRTALEEKEANLSAWLEQASEEEKKLYLGPAAESAVDAQLETIENALEELEEGQLGMCEVCHGMVDENLLELDYTSCVCLEHYSEQQRRQLETELELSQNLQRALLPQQIPPITGLDIAAFSRPAQIVTGDYFDFVQFKDGSPGIVIADVSGHGVSAGMLMTSLQTAFQTLAPDAESPVDVLQRINRLFMHNIKLTTFVTVFFGKLDPESRTLSYASAGHPAFLYRASTDQDIWLARTAPAIGLVEDSHVGLAEIQLEPDDVLVLYTDGITEAMDANHFQFGEQALASVIRQNKQASAQALVSEILGSVKSHIKDSEVADDITLVVCKAVPQPVA
jgi:sigma-B regulation protein RsbU (phosphoserine phosphatase)